MAKLKEQTKHDNWLNLLLLNQHQRSTSFPDIQPSLIFYRINVDKIMNKIDLDWNLESS